MKEEFYQLFIRELSSRPGKLYLVNSLYVRAGLPEKYTQKLRSDWQIDRILILSHYLNAESRKNILNGVVLSRAQYRKYKNTICKHFNLEKVLP